MAVDVIKIDDSNLRVGLGKLRLSLGGDEPLMRSIGLYMMGSVARTFRGKGSPAGSWRPLAPSTIRSDPKFYGARHKLLIGRTGRLFNSIHSEAGPGQVTIGTNLVYAAVHQFGSRDRGAMGEGPRTIWQDAATRSVKQHNRTWNQASLGKGILRGRQRLILGPRNQKVVSVSAHQRHQNIPARPYLVFRPEDRSRIRGLVLSYIRRSSEAAGLGGN
jgi:phage gpG-like protein